MYLILLFAYAELLANGFQANLTNIRTNILNQSTLFPSVISSTTLTLSITNQSFSSGTTLGNFVEGLRFQDNQSVPLALSYGQFLHSETTIFGQTNQYVAEIINNYVFVSSYDQLNYVTTYCFSTTLNSGYDQPKSAPSAWGADLVGFGQNFKVYAHSAKKTGSNIWMVHGHIFDRDSINAVSYSLVSGSYRSCFTIKQNIQYFQISMVFVSNTDPNTNLYRMMETLFFVSFKDQTIPISDMLLNTPVQLLNMKGFIPKIVTYNGGADTGTSIPGGNFMSNSINTFSYTQQTLKPSTNLGPTSWNSYFTYNYNQLIWFSAFQIPPTSKNNCYKIIWDKVFQNVNKISDIFVKNGIVYQYYYVSQYTCPTTSQGILSTLIITPKHTLGQGSDLLDQNFSYPTDYVLQVNNPREYLLYYFYIESCSTYNQTNQLATVWKIIQNLFNCHYSCQACQNALNNGCVTCSSISHRQYITAAKTCPCIQGYYDDGSSPVCATCVQPCLGCTAANTCSSCSASQNRILVSNQCQCIQGYIDLQSIKNYVCLMCTSTCLTCLNQTAPHCQSCDSTKYRYLNQRQCLCMNGYFENSSKLCQVCGYRCLTCINQANNCQSCSSSQYRSLQNNDCVCQNGYYDDGSSSVCKSCNSGCLTCMNITECLTCRFQFTLPKQLCVCQSGYYQNNDWSCSKCNYSCLTCLNNSTCQSCNVTAFRLLNNSNCVCQDGYYDDGLKELCKPCLKQCKTCLQPNTCETCRSPLLNASELCQCVVGYYFDYDLISCVLCEYSCLACSQNDTCDTCRVSDQRKLLSFQCVCNDGYYDDGQNSLCATCLPSCKTCQHSSNCLTCFSQNQDAQQLCECKEGYFPDNNDCQVCHYSCLTCLDSNSCLTCQEFRDQQNGGLCTCIGNYFETNKLCHLCDSTSNRTLIDNECVCDHGYYDDGVGVMCQKCPLPCLTCLNNTYCQSCKSQLQIVEQICQCQQGYFEDQGQCQSCHYSCLTCSNQTSCLSCKVLRVKINFTCICQSQYYEDNQTCILCDSSLNKLITQNQCVCKDGYYQVDSTSACQTCPQTCKTCVNNNTCLSCYSNLQQVTSQCSCQQGYYQSGQSCSQCNFTCLTCLDETYCITCTESRILTSERLCVCGQGYFENNSQCVTCNKSQHRHLEVNQCICDEGYFEQESKLVCEVCPFHCKSCIDNQSCTTCHSPNQIIQDNCLCESGYYNDELGCTLCHYSCTSCQNNSSCTSCQHLRIQNNSGLCFCEQGYKEKDHGCICLDGYYADGLSLHCLECSSNCKTCTNNTSCESCSDSLQIVENLCQCQNGYYLDEQICIKCHYSCIECLNDTSCLVCQHLRILLNEGLCFCQEGYYEQNQECTICNGHELRQIFNNSCTCIDGYYESVNKSCLKCPSSCKRCRSAKICTTCQLSSQNVQKLCQCEQGYYNQDINCLKCHYSCKECHNSSSCVTCLKDRELRKSSYCLCRQGSYELDNKCYPCSTKANSTAYNLTCIKQSQACSQGYYSVDKECQKCDERCLTCNGWTQYDCLSCKYIRYKQQCHLCEEVQGYYLNITQCSFVCGDGWVHPQTEQCDDGNLINDDACTNDCKIGLQIIDASLYMSMDYPLYQNKRQAQITLTNSIQYDQKYWDIYLQILKRFSYQITSIFQGQVIIDIDLHQSTFGDTLIVIPDPHQQIRQKILQTTFPNYQAVSGSEKNAAIKFVRFTQYMMDIILIIMIVSILTGGFEMLWNIIDIIQYFSYLCFINVQFPYNLEMYFQYLSQFNLQVITQKISLIDQFRYEITTNYDQQSIQAQKKIQEAGFTTLFWANIFGIFIVWIGSVLFYIFCNLMMKFLERFEMKASDDLDEGLMLKFQIIRAKIVRILLVTISPIQQQFYTSGLLRTLLSSMYDLNFAIFLELSNHHFLYQDFLLCTSSYFCLLFFVYEVYFILQIQILLDVRPLKHIFTIKSRKQIGSLMEQVDNINNPMSIYIPHLMNVKKVIFMAGLIFFQDFPIIQILFISSLSVISLVLNVSSKTTQDSYEYLKIIIFDSINASILLFMLLFAVNEAYPLEYYHQSIIGWIIMVLCSIILLVEIYVDIRKNFHEIHKRIQILQRFLHRRWQRKVILGDLFSSSNLQQQDITPTLDTVQPLRK